MTEASLVHVIQAFRHSDFVRGVISVQHGDKIQARDGRLELDT